jgi:predicted transcriptional regulator
MEPSPPKVITSLTLPAGLRAELDIEATKQRRSRSWLTGEAIREYLERRRAVQVDQW